MRLALRAPFLPLSSALFLQALLFYSEESMESDEVIIKLIHVKLE